MKQNEFRILHSNVMTSRIKHERHTQKRTRALNEIACRPAPLLMSTPRRLRLFIRRVDRSR